LSTIKSLLARSIKDRRFVVPIAYRIRRFTKKACHVQIVNVPLYQDVRYITNFMKS
jgi:hypothetical protein